MIDKSIYILKDKTPNEVKEAFIYYMGDKNATTKQIKNAKDSKYAKIDSSDMISDVLSKLGLPQNIYEITNSEQIQDVSTELTSQIEELESNPKEQKEPKNQRSYVNKYRDFLMICEECAIRAKNKEKYIFSEDNERPFINKDAFEKITGLLSRKKNIILEGAPGVGKTFLARKIAYQLIGEKKDENIEMVQFHQSYSYEDFIQGIRPSEDGCFVRRDGIFLNFCKRARRTDEPCVFIIDEINRGNISKILGELMMLIEADKRSKRYAIKLTYSDDEDEKFFVPDNVYIIGCMNTADRSLAIVDYALRRRFRFCSIKPEFNDAFKAFLISKGISEANAVSVISKVTSANREIATIDKGLEIGHSYFCQTEGADDFEQWWNDICEYELFPYIREICFDDEDKCEYICNKLKF